jgi:hypothetical protein
MSNNEKWIPVVGYSEFYEVSDLGRVRSIAHVCIGRGRPYSGRVLKPKIDRDGYKQLGLRKHGKRSWMRVHRLVWEAFSGKTIPVGFQVDHLDGVRSNNAFRNLHAVPASANVRLSDIRNGGRAWLRGVKNPMAKLTEEQVSEIRRLKKEGVPQIRIAERFGVGAMQISRIVRYKRRIFA